MKMRLFHLTNVMIALGMLTLASNLSSWSAEPKRISPEAMSKYTIGGFQDVGKYVFVTEQESGAYRIVSLYDGELSVPLFVYDDPGFEAVTVFYSADIRCENTDKRVYLEMLCTFPDGKTYFSRGVTDSLLEPTNFLSRQTPFFLKSGQKPTQITVGLRFEGKGAAVLKNIELKKADNSLRSSLYFYQFVMPRMLGGIYGLWGAAIGIIGGTMIQRGRFKKLVISLIAGMGVFSIAIFILGITLDLNTGLSSSVTNQYYLCAAIGVILSIVFIPMVLKQYQAVELRKMQAKDIG